MEPQKENQQNGQQKEEPSQQKVSNSNESSKNSRKSSESKNISRNSSRSEKQSQKKSVSSKRSKSDHEEERSKRDFKTLYVCNLKKDILDIQLEKFFAPFGEVERIKVLREPQDNMCRGYGFVTFRNSKDALKALDDLNNTDFEGQKINIEISKRSQPRPKTPGVYKGRSKDGRDRGRRSFDSRHSRYDRRRDDYRSRDYKRDRRDDRYRRDKYDDRRRDRRDDRRDDRYNDRDRSRYRDDRDYQRKRSID